MASGQQPAYRAYTVVKREGAEDFWLAIGAAFMHQDGDGYNGDGGNYEIQNLTINEPFNDDVGLFSHVDSNGIIQNISFAGAAIRMRLPRGNIPSECA